MRTNTYRVRSEVWLYPGSKAPWHFVSLSKKQSETVKKTFGAHARGWGSLPVRVTVGKTSWKTSIFPDKKEGVYLLPLKAGVRVKEGIRAGNKIRFLVEIKA